MTRARLVLCATICTLSTASAAYQSAPPIVDARVATYAFLGATLILATCIGLVIMTWQGVGLDPMRVFRCGPAVPEHLDNRACEEAHCMPLTRATPYYAGLSNPSIDCFFNSVVQSFASLAYLARYLDETACMARRWGVVTPITDALRGLFVALDTPQKRRTTLVPNDLRRALRSVSQSNGIRTLVSAAQQQDAHELCVLLIDALDSELGAVQQARALAVRVGTTGLSSLMAPSRVVHGRLRMQLGTAGDHVANPFRGTLAQRTSCARCGYMEAVRHFSFTDIDVVVPGSSCTLEECLAAWMQLEQIEWVCHRCSLNATRLRLETERAALNTSSRKQARRAVELDAQHARVSDVIRSGAHESELDASHALDGIVQERVISPCATKQIMIASCPPILVIHVNRSSFSLGNFGASKNHARVVFRECMDMAPFMTGSTLSSNPLKPLSSADRSAPVLYTLRAVITHYGTHNYGHYVSFRQRPHPGKSEDDDMRFAWTRVSDENVQLCSWSDVHAQNPYLLMYERLEPPTMRRAPPTPTLIPRTAQPATRTVHRWDAYTLGRQPNTVQAH